MILPGGIPNNRAAEGDPEADRVHSRWMDPLDHLLALPDGLRCTVCDQRVPVTRIRTLARRDDLTFIEIDCEACSSSTLGFLLAGQTDEPRPAPDLASAHAGTPITSDDVLDMHELLASWRGDLTELLNGGDGGRSGHGRAEPGR